MARGYELALEIRDTLTSLSLRVPQDVSLLFLGVPPGPTTLSGQIAPVEEMARWAARHAAQSIIGENDAGGGKTERQAEAPVQHFATRCNAGDTIGPAPDTRR